MSDEKDNIYLYDGGVRFWTRHVVSYGTLLGCIGLGIVTGSDALQWIGGAVWFVGLMGMAVAFNNHALKTPQQAADYLAARYGAVANGAALRDQP